QEDLELIFSEFQILTAKPTGNEQCVGLGLAISKKIIEEHNGCIQAENRTGGGSVFSFTLPVIIQFPSQRIERKD
ncbi:MAG: hybrid sensor histidine kinase/response regulator, partial [Candidatus Electrothrix sp. AR3]|nr:hybrid sensor histidine kinase/response regulator [Candidatus Electrothrix sp. AR3]